MAGYGRHRRQWVNYNRFGIFRRDLDAEMKDATKGAERIYHRQERKKKEERKFWKMNLLGMSSVESLHTVYFYN